MSIIRTFKHTFNNTYYRSGRYILANVNITDTFVGIGKNGGTSGSIYIRLILFLLARKNELHNIEGITRERTLVARFRGIREFYFFK